MNCSRLVKALAVAGLLGFGSHAFGAFTEIAGDTFENYDEGTFTNQLDGTSWSFTDGDMSEITTQTVASITADLPVGYDKYGAAESTQVLKLNTEGNDLKFTTNTTEYATVLVDTLIKMVGSESEQAIATNDYVQTAVYLDTSDTNSPTLKAYITGAGDTNEWVALSAEGVDVEDGDWVWLQVTINYDQDNTMALVSYKVNDTTLTNAAGASSFMAANNTHSYGKKKVTEVAFRGTGMVDNFSIAEETQQAAVATIVTRFVDEEGKNIDQGMNFQYDYTIGSQSYGPMFFDSPARDHPQYTLVGVVLKDGDFNVISNFPGDTVSFSVSDTMFSDGQTYYVDGVYALPDFTVTVNFESTGGYTPPPETNTVTYGENFTFVTNGLYDTGTLMVTNVTAGGAAFAFTTPLLANVTADATLLLYGVNWIEPAPPADDVTFTIEGGNNANLVFTSMTIAGTTLTVEFTADGTVNQNPATLWVLYKDALVDGTEGDVAVEAAVVQDGTSFDGTITIDLGQVALPDSVFVTGLSSTDPTP